MVLVCPNPGSRGRAQDLIASGEHARDASGNPILVDSGVWLRNEIKKALKDADVKYIDPSYMIRSVPTISADRIYCKARDVHFPSSTYAPLRRITLQAPHLRPHRACEHANSSAQE